MLDVGADKLHHLALEPPMERTVLQHVRWNLYYSVASALDFQFAPYT